MEEEYLLRRSILKGKNITGNENLENQAVPIPVDDETQGENKRPPASYRDTLLAFNGLRVEEGAVEHNWKERQQMEEAQEDWCEVGMEVLPSRPWCPNFPVGSTEYNKECELWCHALIVKLLGRRMVLKFLKARLQRMWNVKGTFEFIDMENDFFLV